MKHLDEIRERLAAATPGPWHFDTDADDYLMSPAGEVPPSLANGKFIGHARQDVPRLLAALDGVLALHQPERGTVYDSDYGETKEMDYCETCSDSQWLDEASAVAWPCPTVATVTTGLEGQG